MPSFSELVRKDPTLYRFTGRTSPGYACCWQCGDIVALAYEYKVYDKDSRSASFVYVCESSRCQENTEAGRGPGA